MTAPLARAAAKATGWALAGALLVAGCAATDQPAGRKAPDAVSSLPQGEGDESDIQRRARIRVDLAASYYQQRNFSVAIEEVKQALAADPAYAPAHGLLGLIYMDLGDRERADESFQRGLKTAPADSDLNNNYGWYLCQTGREAQSIAYFMAAVKNPLYTTPARPWHNAGICTLRLGDDKAAEGYFQRSFQLDPSNPVAMYHLGELYFKRGEAERAKFYAQRLVRAFEPSPETLWLAYRIERRGGDRDAADSYASQLRRRFPASREAAALAAGQAE